MYFNKAADGWRNTVKLSRTLFLGRLRATVFLSLRALHLTANLLLQNMYDLVDLFRNLYIKLLSVFLILFQEAKTVVEAGAASLHIKDALKITYVSTRQR